MKKILTLTPLCALCFSTCIYGMRLSPEQIAFAKEQLESAQKAHTELITLLDENDTQLGQIEDIMRDLQNLKQQVSNSNTFTEEEAEVFFGRIMQNCAQLQTIVSNEQVKRDIAEANSYVEAQNQKDICCKKLTRLDEYSRQHFQFNLVDFLDPDKKIYEETGFDVLYLFAYSPEQDRLGILSDAFRFVAEKGKKVPSSLVSELAKFFDDPQIKSQVEILIGQFAQSIEQVPGESVQNLVSALSEIQPASNKADENIKILEELNSHFAVYRQFYLSDFLNPAKPSEGNDILYIFARSSDEQKLEILTTATLHPANAGTILSARIIRGLAMTFSDPQILNRAVTQLMEFTRKVKIEKLETIDKKYHQDLGGSIFDILVFPTFDFDNELKAKNKAWEMFVDGPDEIRLRILRQTLQDQKMQSIAKKGQDIPDEVIGELFSFFDDDRITIPGFDQIPDCSQYLLLLQTAKFSALEKLFDSHEAAWSDTFDFENSRPSLWDARTGRSVLTHEEFERLSDPDKLKEIQETEKLKRIMLRLVILQAGALNGGKLRSKFWHEDLPYIIYNNQPLISSFLSNVPGKFISNIRNQFTSELKKMKIELDVNIGLPKGILRENDLINPLFALILRNGVPDRRSNNPAEYDAIYDAISSLMNEGATGTDFCKFDPQQMEKYFPSLSPAFVGDSIEINFFGWLQMRGSEFLSKILGRKNFKIDPFLISHGIRFNSKDYFPSWLLLCAQGQAQLIEALRQKHILDKKPFLSEKDYPYILSFFAKNNENDPLNFPLIFVPQKVIQEEADCGFVKDEISSSDKPSTLEEFMSEQRKRKPELAKYLLSNEILDLSFLTDTNSFLFDAQFELFSQYLENDKTEIDLLKISQILKQSGNFANQIVTYLKQPDQIKKFSKEYFLSQISNAAKSNDFPAFHFLWHFSRIAGVSIEPSFLQNLLEILNFNGPQIGNLSYIKDIKGKKAEKAKKVLEASKEREKLVNGMLKSLGSDATALSETGDTTSYYDKIVSLLQENIPNPPAIQEEPTATEPVTVEQKNDETEKQENISERVTDNAENAPVQMNQENSPINENLHDDEVKEKSEKKLTRQQRRALEQQSWKNKNKKKSNKKKLVSLEIKNEESSVQIPEIIQKPIVEISEKSSVQKLETEITENSSIQESSTEITGKSFVQEPKQEIEDNQMQKTDLKIEKNPTLTDHSANPIPTPEQIMIPQNINNNSNQRSANGANNSKSKKNKKDDSFVYIPEKDQDIHAMNSSNNVSKTTPASPRNRVTGSNQSNAAKHSFFSAKNLSSFNPRRPALSGIQSLPKPEIVEKVVYRYITEQVIDMAGKNLTPDMQKRMLLDFESEAALSKLYGSQNYDFNFTAKNGQNLLHYRVKHGNLEELKALYAKFPKQFMEALRHQDIGGWTPMHLAAKYNPNIYYWFLSIEPSQNITDKNDNTPRDIFRYYQSKK